jgi:hypothetical protein
VLARFRPINMAFRVPTYFALRVCLRADAPDWWAAAHRAHRTAPPPVRAILGGRTRVEVSAQEARAAIAWAAALDGWDPDGFNPLWVYPALPEV